MKCACKKCGYEWEARGEKPKACPECKSRGWDQLSQKAKIAHFEASFPHPLNSNEYLEVFPLVIGGKATTYNPDYFCPYLGVFIELATSQPNVSQQGVKWRAAIKGGLPLRVFWWEGEEITEKVAAEPSGPHICSCPHCGATLNMASLLAKGSSEKKAKSSRENGTKGFRPARPAEIDQEPSKAFDPKGPEVERVYLPEPKPRKRKRGAPPEAPDEIQVEAPAAPWAKINIPIEGPATVEKLPPRKYTGETAINFGRQLYEIEDEKGRKTWTITPPPPSSQGARNVTACTQAKNARKG